MVIPHKQLKPETLNSLIEEFVTRHMHGQSELSMPVMVAQVMGQLESGKAVIQFDEEDGTCSIVPKDTPRPKGPSA